VSTFPQFFLVDCSKSIQVGEQRQDNADAGYDYKAEKKINDA